ncbi:efflux RND transporter periplasmic adaptor subunit [Flavobacterium sp. RSSA_27]|uniref:efflux RND transporter periplasmic adaptor subunit n=1 Tax=Flavobacterium sp. RSSA_27 TaxID=3447667 RepID=UPI003F34BDE9
MNKYIKYGLVFTVISIIGFGMYYFVVKSKKSSEKGIQNEVYTCSMHPEIIRNEPGNCPICGMTLVKKATESKSPTDNSIDNLLKPTDKFVVGNYQTTIPKDTVLNSEISLPGIVAYDPNSAVNIAARIGGRIERMYVNYKYQKVTKGQKLFEIYSPELLTEQQNFIYIISNDADNTSIRNAAKKKLLLYGMTNSQINSLISSKSANPKITIYSPATGIISGTEKMNDLSSSSMQNATNNTEVLDIKEGNYIKKGEIIFKLKNTDKVWGVFNVLQGYNNQITTRQSITIRSEMDEADSFDAQINFIETQLNPSDKSNTVRVYLNNDRLKLPIGTRLEGIVKVNPLKAIWLQKQALVSIGDKKIVFLKMANGFKATAIKTGIERNDFVQILSGISSEDTIAKNAQYLIDSESFIKPD